MAEIEDDFLDVRPVETSGDLAAVKEIYRTHKATLGFLPDGVFQQRASAKQILVAEVDGKIVGYVLFAINQRDEVRIVHLCVSPAVRMRGIGKRLIASLVQTFPKHSRIRLNCRADYDAAKAWRRLGFSETRRFAGKKHDGSELIVFSLAISEMPLFDGVDAADDSATVICDTNICIDIEVPTRPHHNASSGLLADWLSDEITLKVTPEIIADLQRQDDPLRRDMLAAIKRNWEQVTVSHLEVEGQLQEIRRIMGEPKDDSSASDQRHLAIAAAYEAAAFVTRDEELLGFREDLISGVGLRLGAPSEIIAEYDSVLNSHRYQYRELTRSGIERHRVMSVDEFELDLFFKSSDGERRTQFRAQLNEMLAAPRNSEVYRICNRENESIAMVAINVLPDGYREIVRLRLNHQLVETRFGRVIADYIADQPLGAWRSGEVRVLKITDPFPSALIVEACGRRGWCNNAGTIWRISIPGTWHQGTLDAELTKMVDSGRIPIEVSSRVHGLIHAEHGVGQEEITQLLERLIHPGKVTFGELPTWVVPIEPRWAKELFDFRLWDMPLFDPDTSLVINPDSAYYKRPRNSPTAQVGRILWYVSGKPRDGGRHVRACSALTRLVSGTVKDLFREFQRFGVFEWRHLMDFFGGPDEMGLAIEFTSTELFEKPVSLDELNDVLEANGMKRNTFPSAVRIPDAAFHEVYSRSVHREN